MKRREGKRRTRCAALADLIKSLRPRRRALRLRRPHLILVNQSDGARDPRETLESPDIY